MKYVAVQVRELDNSYREYIVKCAPKDYTEAAHKALDVKSTADKATIDVLVVDVFDLVKFPCINGVTK